MLLPLLAAAAMSCSPLLSHQVDDIVGGKEDLCQYAGKVVLVVNTASYCGYTPQYKGLQALNEKYKSRGLVILGFPSNDFGGQEPGTEAEIKKFCSLKYNVGFPMFAKVKTKGEGQAPLYKYLSQKGEPQWNFHKYLVGKDGVVKAAFPSKIAPDSPELRAAIDAALKE